MDTLMFGFRSRYPCSHDEGNNRGRIARTLFCIHASRYVAISADPLSRAVIEAGERTWLVACRCHRGFECLEPLLPRSVPSGRLNFSHAYLTS